MASRLSCLFQFLARLALTATSRPFFGTRQAGMFEKSGDGSSITCKVEILESANLSCR